MYKNVFFEINQCHFILNIAPYYFILFMKMFTDKEKILWCTRRLRLISSRMKKTYFMMSSLSSVFSNFCHSAAAKTQYPLKINTRILRITILKKKK